MKYRLLCLFVTALLLSSAVASHAQFGKNKVQYQEFDWKYIESKHFDVYFHGDAKYLAEFTALNAEEALPKIERILGFKLSKRISIVVYNSQNEFQQTNIISSFLPEGVGGVTELMKNRVVLPFFGSYGQLRHVTHHELIHAVMNDMYYGGSIQTAVYSGNLANLPLWISEGLAEWSSLGQLDFETDIFMRDLFMGSNPPGLMDLDGYYAYRGGQAFYWYVDRVYGEEKITELLNRIKITRSVDLAFRGCFQMSLEEFSEKWVADMKKFYFPDIAKFQAPEDYAIRVTNHEKLRNFYNTSPAISPDGSRMVYIADKEGLFRIFLLDLEKTGKEPPTPKLLISSFRSQDFEDLNMLTPGLSWSPDGKKIAISAKAGENDAIFIVDPNTSDYDKIDIGMKSISSVAWSYDGDKIAFIGIKDQQSDVYVYSIPNKRVDQLTNDVFTDHSPVWAHDNKTIFFISDRDSITQQGMAKDKFSIWKHDVSLSDIFSLDVGSGKITRVTHSGAYNKTSLAISDDDKKLLFVSDRNGIGNIYELNLVTGAERPKTNSISGITQISLSPDSRVLLFSSLRNSGYDIFKIRNPFDKNLPGDTVPITPLREKLNEKIARLQSFSKSIPVKNDPAAQPEKLAGYGDFSVEFSRQQVVKTNPDAIKNDVAGAQSFAKNSVDTNFVVNPYKVKFTPDIILGNPSYNTFYGVQGVAQALFSDVMGNHQLYIQANLLYDLKNSSFMVSYYYLPGQIDYSFSGYHTAAYVWLKDGDLYRFRKYGADVSAYYPFDFFNRIEWGVGLQAYSRENLDNTNVSSITRFLVVPQAKYVHDDVLWGDFAPVRGSRYNVEVTGAPKLSTDGVGFMNITGDYRTYFNLSDYINFAFRGSAGASMGPNPQKFCAGGTENWINASFENGYLPFENPEDFAFTQFLMPLRGYAVNALTGDKFFMINGELRLPMRIFIASPLPMFVQNIHTAAFFDMAGVWSGDFSNFKATTRDLDGYLVPKNLLIGSGIGLRAYLLGIPAKLDIAWAYLVHNWSQPKYMFSLGYDF